MIIFTESKAVPPPEWKLLGAGQTLVPRRSLQLLVWGVAYDVPDVHSNDTLIKIRLSDGQEVEAVYIR